MSADFTICARRLLINKFTNNRLCCLLHLKNTYFYCLNSLVNTEFLVILSAETIYAPNFTELQNIHKLFFFDCSDRLNGRNHFGAKLPINCVEKAFVLEEVRALCCFVCGFDFVVEAKVVWMNLFYVFYVFKVKWAKSCLNYSHEPNSKM